MLFPKQVVILTGLVSMLLPLGACANGPMAEALQRSLAADPRLEASPVASGTPSSDPSATGDEVQLPADFPAQIPRYPGAQLLQVIPADGSTQTRWSTTDTPEQVSRFYQDIFQSNDWKVTPADGAASDGAASAIAAERDGLRVNIAVAAGETASPSPNNASPDNAPDASSPSASPTGNTAFTLSYSQDAAAAEAQPTASASPQTNLASAPPQPGDPDFIGPVLPSGSTAQSSPAAQSSPTAQQSSQSSPTSSSQTFSDLSQAPEELRQYIEDLGKLGVLPLGSGSSNGAFKPTATITRREYARWLVAANNLFYGDRPAQKIRLGVNTDQPAFRDVPRTDPDFAEIQGLAEAGLIPSPLSGDATTVTFRPDAPLTRENLILWKTPIDTRQTLPNATVQAVQQTWGFQDAARIDPRALRAVLADFQNGDLSNTRRAFGYTTLLQPKKTVTRAEAAAVLWYFGSQGEGISAKDALQAKGQGQ